MNSSSVATVCWAPVDAVVLTVSVGFDPGSGYTFDEGVFWDCGDVLLVLTCSGFLSVTAVVLFFIVGEVTKSC